MKFYNLALISAVACATDNNVPTPAPAGANSNATNDIAPATVATKSNATTSNATTSNATTSNATTSDSSAPSFSPNAVNAIKLTSVELSLPWDSPCSETEKPSFKISVDADAIKAGAFISSIDADGVEVQGFQGDKDVENTEISGKSEEEVKKDRLTSLVFSFKKSVDKSTVKAKILYLAQKVDKNKTMDTSFEIELKCGTKTLKSFKKTDNNAPILKVSSATPAALAFAASFTLLSTLYFYL
ncbi:hypothetical protein DSO57_1018602 [Entomophthora muscae]|uniref:Uncharacterized protein n=1 Tax=Entomophthora muscae TaxID=34485 RepID=A0ACC2S6C8_9FUNG|nr:hypothetical protein DSO57_1018602 [Entomophthora muscae]